MAMEMLWYQLVRPDGEVVLVPVNAISRVTQDATTVKIFLQDGKTLSFNGTIESLFGEIGPQQAALGITMHTITWVEPA